MPAGAVCDAEMALLLKGQMPDFRNAEITFSGHTAFRYGFVVKLATSYPWIFMKIGLALNVVVGLQRTKYSNCQGTV